MKVWFARGERARADSLGAAQHMSRNSADGATLQSTIDSEGAVGVADATGTERSRRSSKRSSRASTRPATTASRTRPITSQRRTIVFPERTRGHAFLGQNNTPGPGTYTPALPQRVHSGAKQQRNTTKFSETRFAPGRGDFTGVSLKREYAGLGPYAKEVTGTFIKPTFNVKLSPTHKRLVAANVLNVDKLKYPDQAWQQYEERTKNAIVST